jgi:hypothetical protein
MASIFSSTLRSFPRPNLDHAMAVQWINASCLGIDDDFAHCAGEIAELNITELYSLRNVSLVPMIYAHCFRLHGRGTVA